jgi:hypothetical protein
MEKNKKKFKTLLGPEINLNKKYCIELFEEHLEGLRPSCP